MSFLRLIYADWKSQQSWCLDECNLENPSGRRNHGSSRNGEVICVAIWYYVFKSHQAHRSATSEADRVQGHYNHDYSINSTNRGEYLPALCWLRSTLVAHCGSNDSPYQPKINISFAYLPVVAYSHELCRQCVDYGVTLSWWDFGTFAMRSWSLQFVLGSCTISLHPQTTSAFGFAGL